MSKSKRATRKGVTEFQPETYIKIVPKDLTIEGFTFKLGLNYCTKNFKEFPQYQKTGGYFSVTDGLGEFDCDYDTDVYCIIKIPITVSVVKTQYDDHVDCKSPCIYIESIHSYTDFVENDTIVPEIKRKMKIPHLRMPLFHTDKEACLKAVKKNGANIKYIKDSAILDRHLCLEAVKNSYGSNHGDALEHIKDSPLLDREICLAAVKQDGYAIRFIKDSPFLDKEICMEAVKKVCYAIDYIKDSPLCDKEVCLIAVKGLKHIINEEYGYSDSSEDGLSSD